LVSIEDHIFDLVAGHVGAGFTTGVPFVCHTHGMHWTADYPCDKWQWGVNAKLIEAIRRANEVTVPSAWVAETFQRDMRFTPHIVPHGIDVREWEFAGKRRDYVLWNKNRPGDVCDPRPVRELAERFPKQHFVTTYVTKGAKLNNVNVLGTIPYEQMRGVVQQARMYLSTTKETFGIGVLEAMASGVPVLGYAHGGNVALVEHGVTGYLAEPGDIDDLSEGLDYCLRHWQVLGANGREKAKQYRWVDACEQVARIYEMALEPEPPTVAIVIPVYNKTEEQLERAISSARSQTFDEITRIVIVDDGTPERDYQECESMLGWLDNLIRVSRAHGIEESLKVHQNIYAALTPTTQSSQGSSKFVCKHSKPTDHLE
jgi:glycosyltransferase involved in cell wall biosynthesis